MNAMLCFCFLTSVSARVLNPNELSVVKKEFFRPQSNLKEIAYVLNNGLKSYYENVHVDIVDCPDLTQPPFMLANRGLNGNPNILDVGGLLYGMLPEDQTRIYDFSYIPELIDMDSVFILGASPGSKLVFGESAELFADINISKDEIIQLSKVAKYVNGNGENWYVQEDVLKNNTKFTYQGNFFASEGKPGPVLKIYAQKRIGSYNLPTSIIKSLVSHYGNKTIGLGGTFLIKNGKAKVHVMPNTRRTNYADVEEARNWFKYFNMSSPLIAVGVLVTNDFDFELQDQHFHIKSEHGDSGHYHIDTTPDIIEYEGYFNVAEYVYGIDKPEKSAFPQLVELLKVLIE